METAADATLAHSILLSILLMHSLSAFVWEDKYVFFPTSQL